jgi:archaetidylinositol phosphate synthase
VRGTECSDRRAFAEATRTQGSLLSRVERRCLLWLAERLPMWVSPDHLTLVGLVSSIGIGVFYSIVRLDRRGLFAVSVLLAVNWFGDSLDGTLARVRRRERPRYGFYIDHIVDSLGAVLLLGGLGLSGLMSPGIAAGLLIAFLILSVEVYLATYTVGTFEISHWRISPTEIRIVLAVFNVVVYWFPAVKIQAHSYLLFDLLGELGIACGAGMFVAAILRNVRTLRRVDPPKL